MALGTLSIDLEAKLASFERDMGKAARETEKSAQRMAAALDTVKSAVAAMVGAFSVGAFVSVVKGSIDAADGLRDMSQQTGIAVEALGGLGFAASQSGGNLESIVAAAGKLNKSIAEAAAGSKEAAEPFKALGISISDAAGKTKTADVVFAEVADRFKTFEDGPQKAAIALRLFGKAGAEQIALLNEGGESLREAIAYYKQFSGVTQELSEKADRFNDTLGKINLIQKSIGNDIASKLLPVIQILADEFLRAKENGSAFSLIGDALRVAFEAATVLGANVAFTLAAVGREIGAIAAQGAALARLDFKGFSAISDAVKADGEKARAELDLFERRVLGLDAAENARAKARLQRQSGDAGSAKTPAPSLSGGGKSGPEKAQQYQNQTTALDAYYLSLQKTLAAEDQLTEVQRAQLRISEASAQGFSELRRAELLATAARVDAMKEAERREKAVQRASEQAQQYILGLNKENAASEERNKSLKIEFENMGLTTEALGRLEVARLDETIAQQQQLLATARASQEAPAELEALERKIELLKAQRDIVSDTNDKQVRLDAQKSSEETARQLHEDVKGALSSAFLQSGGRPAKAFADAVGSILFSRIAGAAADALATFAVGSGKPGGDGGLFGSALKFLGLSFDGGGSTGSGPRTGGLDGKGGFMAMVHPNETIVDHTKGQRSGVVVNISQTVGDVATVSMLQKNNAALVRQIQAGIGRSQNYGGALA